MSMIRDGGYVAAVPKSPPAPVSSGPSVTVIGGTVGAGPGGVTPKIGGGVSVPYTDPFEWGPRREFVIASGAGANGGGPGSVTPSPALGPKVSLFMDRMRQRIFEAGTFPVFRVRLWQRGRDGVLTESIRAGGIGDMDIPVGKYIITFKAPDGRPYSSDVEKPIDVGGKTAVIEKVRTYDDGRMVVMIRLEENLIGVLLVIGAVAAGVGLAGFGLADALESVDRVVVDTTDQAVKIGIIGGIGFLGYVLLKKKKVL